MNILTFDFECTTSNKGNPFDQTNKAVCLGVKYPGHVTVVYHYPYDEQTVKGIQSIVDKADLLVAFNAKFDLHWLHKIGINFEGKRVWDTQLAEFLFENQRNPYPSLEKAAEKYGFPRKIDIVKLEYWDKGINTDGVPREILTEYCARDVELTEQIFLKQKELFDTTEQSKKFSLFKLQCQDLLVLQEMEWNGLVFQTKEAREAAKKLEEREKEIYEELFSIVGEAPINLGSGDHLSCILFGGTIFVDFRIPVGTYKSGKKVGETRYKIVTKDYQFPRLCEPLEGTEVKKPEGSQPIWKTNVDILNTIKLDNKSKKVVALIKEHAKLDVLKNTFLIGWSNLIDKMNWPKDEIHGNLNQCVAVTGRLSSTKPNQQNADGETKRYMVSRYT